MISVQFTHDGKPVRSMTWNAIDAPRSQTSREPYSLAFSILLSAVLTATGR
jgi:hypothetical protein